MHRNHAQEKDTSTAATPTTTGSSTISSSLPLPSNASLRTIDQVKAIDLLHGLTPIATPSTTASSVTATASSSSITHISFTDNKEDCNNNNTGSNGGSGNGNSRNGRNGVNNNVNDIYVVNDILTNEECVTIINNSSHQTISLSNVYNEQQRQGIIIIHIHLSYLSSLI
jgi:hypothetical protein